MNKLPLPATLARLITEGVWPSVDGRSMSQHEASPTISMERVRRFAPNESIICLEPPPFSTVAVEVSKSTTDFWIKFGALEQIVPEKALIIGDFGLGSDAPIILDFARDERNPPVLYLRWRAANSWVQGARDFNEFARILGLTVQTH